MATLTGSAVPDIADRDDPPRGALLRWVLPAVGAGRIAWLRLVMYLAVALNVAVINGDVGHGTMPQLWQPVTVLRLVHVPPPGVPLLRTVQIVLVVAALAAAAGRAPRALGWPIAIMYLAWQLVDNSYGKRDHDEYAMVVGLFALAGVRSVRFGDTGRDEAASFAVRIIQVAVVCTYFFSAVTKIRNVGWRWTSSSIFVWSLMRPGHPWSRPLLHVPALLVFSQQALISLEFLSPVMLFLRRRWAALGAAGWVLFHLGTWAAIGIHFLPTAVCLTAFLPPGGAARVAAAATGAPFDRRGVTPEPAPGSRLKVLSLEIGTAQLIRVRTGVDLPPPRGHPVRRPLGHQAALTVFSEAALTDLPAIARREVATGRGGPVRTALAGHPSLQRWRGAPREEIVRSYRDLGEAVEPLRDRLLTRLGYTADGPGALRLCTDVHLGRVVNGTTHPVVGVGALGWYGTWVPDGVGAAGPVAEAGRLAERWISAPTERAGLLTRMSALTAAAVSPGTADLQDRAV